MRQIKDSHTASDFLMLFNDSAILNGHQVAGKFHNLGVMPKMQVVKGGLFRHTLLKLTKSFCRNKPKSVLMVAVTFLVLQVRSNFLGRFASTCQADNSKLK